MSQAPAMPVFTDALIGDTTHLSAEEFGAYCRILFATWRNNGVPFDDDNERLCRVSGVAPQRWSRVRKVIVPFFDLTDETWNQKRLKKEWSRVQILIEDRRQKGKLGSDARWLKTNETEMAHANGSGNGLANAPSNAPANGKGNGSGYGNHNHLSKIPPISPKGGLDGSEHLRPASSPARALGYERKTTRKRAPADPFNLAQFTQQQLNARFNDKSVSYEEHAAIRAIIFPGVPEPGY